MDRDEKLFMTLEAVWKIRQYHHNALWEIEKHFAWWLSFIVGGIAFIGVQRINPTMKNVLITIGSIFGLFLTRIALVVIHREGKYFSVALESFNRTSHLLGLDAARDTDPPIMPSYTKRCFSLVEMEANKCEQHLLSKILCPSTLGVRDCFQLIFVVSSYIFLLIPIFAWFRREIADFVMKELLLLRFP